MLNEQTLYHGTIIDNISSIADLGLIPTIGNFVKQWYDEEDYKVEDLVFSADKKGLGKALSAIISHISNKLSKDFHDVTDEEIEKHGALIKIEDGETSFKQKKDDFEDVPASVERGDYYSYDSVSADEILTGKSMLKVLKRYGVWPRTWGPSAAHGKKYYLIRLAIKKHPDKNPREIIKRILSLSGRDIDIYYNRYVN
jgi:hypothetical protein